MAWFRRKFHCEDCDYSWEDEWSCDCDSECPQCGVVYSSEECFDESTNIIENQYYGRIGVYLQLSPDWAEDEPEYEEIEFPTREAAQAWLDSDAYEMWLAMNQQKPQFNKTWVNGDVINGTITLRTAS